MNKKKFVVISASAAKPITYCTGFDASLERWVDWLWLAISLLWAEYFLERGLLVNEFSHMKVSIYIMQPLCWWSQGYGMWSMWAMTLMWQQNFESGYSMFVSACSLMEAVFLNRDTVYARYVLLVRFTIYWKHSLYFLSYVVLAYWAMLLSLWSCEKVKSIFYVCFLDVFYILFVWGLDNGVASLSQS